MNHKYCAVIIILIVLLLVVHLQLRREQFATRREKAMSIYEWFKQTPVPTYTKYKSAMGEHSDVVEYENVLGMMNKTPNFTVESVETHM